MSNETESTRQQKVARQIQRDIGDIFSKEAASLLWRSHGIGNARADEIPIWNWPRCT